MNVTIQEIFYLLGSIVLAILGILLIYVIMFFRRGAAVARQVRQEVSKLADMAGQVKEKLVSPGVFLTGIIGAIIKGINLVNRSRKRRDD